MIKLITKLVLLVALLVAIVASSAPAVAAIHRLGTKSQPLINGCYCIFQGKPDKRSGGPNWQMKYGYGCEPDTNSGVPYQCIQTGCNIPPVSYCSYEIFQ